MKVMAGTSLPMLRNVHFRYWMLILFILACGVRYVHHIAPQAKEAFKEVVAGKNVDLQGHIGCIPAGLKGSI